MRARHTFMASAETDVGERAKDSALTGEGGGRAPLPYLTSFLAGEAPACQLTLGPGDPGISPPHHLGGRAPGSTQSGLRLCGRDAS